MRPLKTSAGALLVGGALGAFGLLAGGCNNMGKSSGDKPTGPTTMTVPMGNMRTGMPQTMPVENTPPPGPTTVPVVSLPGGVQAPTAIPTTLPAAPKPAPTFGATHMLGADSPYYASMPAAGEKPEGTLKAGTKVLLMVPGAPYSKVTTEEGTSVYVMTESLDPVGSKK